LGSGEVFRHDDLGDVLSWDRDGDWGGLKKNVFWLWLNYVWLFWTLQRIKYTVNAEYSVDLAHLQCQDCWRTKMRIVDEADTKLMTSSRVQGIAKCWSHWICARFREHSGTQPWCDSRKKNFRSSRGSTHSSEASNTLSKQVNEARNADPFGGNDHGTFWCCLYRVPSANKSLIDVKYANGKKNRGNPILNWFFSKECISKYILLYFHIRRWKGW
jgi:hypothetical protein